MKKLMLLMLSITLASCAGNVQLPDFEVSKSLAIQFYVLLAIVGLTVIYRIVPYKKWTATKPKFVFLPKYEADFFCPVERIISNLEQQNFQPKGGGIDIYTRGKIWGWSPGRPAKLDVCINQKDRSIKIYAPFIGPLFDTGDTWKITDAIINGLGD